MELLCGTLSRSDACCILLEIDQEGIKVRKNIRIWLSESFKNGPSSLFKCSKKLRLTYN